MSSIHVARFVCAEKCNCSCCWCFFVYFFSFFPLNLANTPELLFFKYKIFRKFSMSSQYYDDVPRLKSRVKLHLMQSRVWRQIIQSILDWFVSREKGCIVYGCRDFHILYHFIVWPAKEKENWITCVYCGLTCATNWFYREFSLLWHNKKTRKICHFPSDTTIHCLLLWEIYFKIVVGASHLYVFVCCHRRMEWCFRENFVFIADEMITKVFRKVFE